MRFPLISAKSREPSEHSAYYGWLFKVVLPESAPPKMRPPTPRLEVWALAVLDLVPRPLWRHLPIRLRRWDMNHLKT